jgi:hypothetical protein
MVRPIGIADPEIDDHVVDEPRHIEEGLQLFVGRIIGG